MSERTGSPDENAPISAAPSSKPRERRVLSETPGNRAVWLASQGNEGPCIVIERCGEDAMGVPAWFAGAFYDEKHPVYAQIMAMAERRTDVRVRLERDARRYRRLRILGAAPGGSRHLLDSVVLCFTNLDRYLDEDLAAYPSRGEAE